MTMEKFNFFKNFTFLLNGGHVENFKRVSDLNELNNTKENFSGKFFCFFKVTENIVLALYLGIYEALMIVSSGAFF